MMKDAACQLVRAVRGSRSQAAFAKQLGYESNPVGRWETGRRFPTAVEMFRACECVGIETRTAFSRFHANPAPDPSDPESLAEWLNALRGSTPILELATRTQVSRFAVSRWLTGRTQPRLHEFLELVDAMTGRACDLVGELVPIRKVPALQAAYDARSVARRLAHEEPWTEAILRILETRAAGTEEVARQLAISPDVARGALDKLAQAGIVVPNANGYRVIGELTVDTKAVPALKAHWCGVAHQRCTAGPRDGDVFSYNVISVSPEDLEAIRQLLRATYREIRSIVSNSQDTQSVALINLQLMTWPERELSDEKLPTPGPPTPTHDSSGKQDRDRGRSPLRGSSIHGHVLEKGP